MERQHILGWILFILIFVVVGIITVVQNNSLRKHMGITDAQVEDCDMGGKEGGTGLWYSFKVRDKTYKGRRGSLNENYYDCLDTYVGKVYKVIYDTTNPHASELLMDRSDYLDYGQIYPLDSAIFKK